MKTNGIVVGSDKRVSHPRDELLTQRRWMKTKIWHLKLMFGYWRYQLALQSLEFINI